MFEAILSLLSVRPFPLGEWMDWTRSVRVRWRFQVPRPCVLFARLLGEKMRNIEHREDMRIGDGFKATLPLVVEFKGDASV